MGTTTRIRTRRRHVALEWDVRPGMAHAHGAARHYRVRREGGRWYAQQRGLTGTYTAVGGACSQKAQAMELCQRYEDGARWLSHRQCRGVPYRRLPS